MATYRAKPPKGTLLNRADPLAKGLVAAWLFNEGSGPVLRDATGGQRTATLTNFATPFTATSGWVDTVYGKGLAFDATNDFCSLVDDNSLDFGEFTILAVCRPDNLSTTGRGLFFNYNSGTFKGYGLSIGYGSSASVVRVYSGNATQAHAAGGTVTAGQWVNVAGTLNGTTGTAYLNGAAVGTNAAMPVPPTSGGILTPVIGCIESTGNGAFGGQVAGVWLYNRALTAGAIARWNQAPFRMFRRSVPVRPARSAGGCGCSLLLTMAG